MMFYVLGLMGLCFMLYWSVLYILCIMAPYSMLYSTVSFDSMLYGFMFFDCVLCSPFLVLWFMFSVQCSMLVNIFLLCYYYRFLITNKLFYSICKWSLCFASKCSLLYIRRMWPFKWRTKSYQMPSLSKWQICVF